MVIKVGLAPGWGTHEMRAAGATIQPRRLETCGIVILPVTAATYILFISSLIGNEFRPLSVPCDAMRLRFWGLEGAPHRVSL